MSNAFEILERTRANVCSLIEQAAAEVECERLEHERQAVAAIEQASSMANIAAAYQQGMQDERIRIKVLIDAQLRMLGRSGLNAMSLMTLNRMIQEAK
jgi:hypothetical protein